MLLKCYRLKITGRNINHCVVMKRFFKGWRALEVRIKERMNGDENL